MSEMPVQVDKLDQPVPFWLMLIMPIYILVIFGVLVFLPAGDWLWINGWVFTTTLALNMTVGYMIINQRNPRVIRNRMKVRKTGITEATRQAAELMPAANYSESTSMSRGIFELHAAKLAGYVNAFLEAELDES